MDMLEGAGFLPVRNFQLFAAGSRVPSQSCLLARRGLSWAWSKRVFHRGSKRWKNVSDTAKYVTAVDAGREPVDFRERLSESVRRSERVAFSLRTNYGVASELVAKAQAEEFATIGLLVLRESRWFLTPKGRLLADSVAEAFI